MDRRAQVLYLENVRDLEVVCSRIKNEMVKASSEYNSRIRSLPTTAKRSEYSVFSTSEMLFELLIGFVLLSPILFAICAFVDDKLPEECRIINVPEKEPKM